MPSIAIVDDRNDQRETLKSLIDLGDHGEWEIIADNPLNNLDDYPSWIRESDVSVLVLDEKLNETNLNISYSGHELVDFIRSRIPDLPIFIVTSWIEVEEIKSRFKDVEDIIYRHDFVTTPQNYIPRFLRAGQKFSSVFKEELSNLSTISKRIVEQRATPDEIEKAKAIKSKLSLEFDVDTLNSKSELLKKFDIELKEFKKLKDEIKQYIG
jgi:hypothetical protein